MCMPVESAQDAAPVFTFHRRIVLSELPLAIVLLSGLKSHASDRTRMPRERAKGSTRVDVPQADGACPNSHLPASDHRN